MYTKTLKCAGPLFSIAIRALLAFQIIQTHHQNSTLTKILGNIPNYIPPPITQNSCNQCLFYAFLV